MKVLIVVDMQNDFIDGSLGTPEAVAIVDNVKKKIESYANKEDSLVVFTRDTHYKNYLSTHEGKLLPVEHCIYDTHGWEIADGLEIPNSSYVNKETFGWLAWDRFTNADQIEIVGLCTDICVVSNALILRAKYPEADITVDASCCAGVTPETHEAALTTMKMCHINVINETVK